MCAQLWHIGLLYLVVHQPSGMDLLGESLVPLLDMWGWCGVLMKGGGGVH